MLAVPVVKLAVEVEFFGGGCPFSIKDAVLVGDKSIFEISIRMKMGMEYPLAKSRMEDSFLLIMSRVSKNLAFRIWKCYLKFWRWGSSEKIWSWSVSLWYSWFLTEFL